MYDHCTKEDIIMPAPGVNIIIDDQSQINPVNLITEDEVDRQIGRAHV